MSPISSPRRDFNRRVLSRADFKSVVGSAEGGKTFEGEQLSRVWFAMVLKDKGQL